jgi:hypothetical protein
MKLRALLTLVGCLGVVAGANSATAAPIVTHLATDVSRGVELAGYYGHNRHYNRHYYGHGYRSYGHDYGYRPRYRHGGFSFYIGPRGYGHRW